MNGASFWLVAADYGLGVATALLAGAAICSFVIWLNDGDDGGAEFGLAALVLIAAAVLTAAGCTSLVAA